MYPYHPSFLVPGSSTRTGNEGRLCGLTQDTLVTPEVTDTGTGRGPPVWTGEVGDDKKVTRDELPGEREVLLKSREGERGWSLWGME